MLNNTAEFQRIRKQIAFFVNEANRFVLLCPDELCSSVWGEAGTKLQPAVFHLCRLLDLAETGETKVMLTENQRFTHLEANKYRLEKNY